LDVSAGNIISEFSSIIKKLIIKWLYRLLVLSSSCFLVAGWHVEAQTGPGGVGNSTSNRLWLKSDAGVYKDAGVTPASAGERVQQWNDYSGNGNNAVQSASSNRPVYQTGIVNGEPSLQFNGDKFIDPAALGIPRHKRI
jgi:hypothetical protein